MVGLEQRISDAKYRRQAEFERTSKAYSLRLVPSSPPMKVLDIGCGTGVNAEALAAKGHEVSGIDISPVAIEKFRARGFDG
ncbi:MAG: class I SAM-dependent methyltransferase, partial [Proteobacteria bacterium]|nr:class I SAM-dependent methyltransferase [Pseudomonadota bacterium]